MDGPLSIFQYPAITVCIYRDDSYKKEDSIYDFEETAAFPHSPRDDFISRYIYHYKKSNGSIIITPKNTSDCYIYINIATYVF